MKKTRILLLVALILLFASSCSDSNIYREYKAICKSDGVYFTSLQEAVDYISTSNSSRGAQQEVTKEIILIRDVDESIRPEKRDGVVITSSRESIMFDFQGYSYHLSVEGAAIKVEGESSVLLKNGSIRTIKSSENAAIEIENGSLVIENFTLNIPEESTFASLKGGTLTVGNDSELSGKLTIDGSSSLLVKGGNITLKEIEEDPSDKGQILIYSGNINAPHDLEERMNEAVASVPEDERGETDISTLHKIVFVFEKEPECLTSGNTSFYFCPTCNERFYDSDGNKPITVEETTIPPLGHDFVKVEGVEATCTLDGNIPYWYCTRCNVLSSDGVNDGDITIENIKIPALGHDWANYMNNGEYHWKECQRCEEVGFKEKHNFGEWVTSEKEGYSTRTCEICGYEEEKSECEIVHVEAKEATCTEDGNIEYWYCKVHHDYFLDKNLTVSTTKDDVVIKAKGHDLKEKYSTSSGKHWLTCNNCDEKINEEMHSWECYTDGDSHWQTCPVCKKTTVAMDYAYNEEGHWFECRINHDYEYTELVPHNFKQEGSKLICQECGYTINKTGDDSGFDVVPIDPTPSGTIVYSREGKCFEFTLVDTNPNSLPTLYIWTVNNEEVKRGDEKTFVFNPSSDGYYTIRCIFLNDNGASSVTVSVDTF